MAGSHIFTLSKVHAEAQPTDPRDIEFSSLRELKSKAAAHIREQAAFAWGEFVQNGDTAAQAAETVLEMFERRVIQDAASPSLSSDPVYNLRSQMITAAMADLVLNNFTDVAEALHALATEA